MPKVENAGMSQAHSAVMAFLDILGITYNTDYTCDANRNTTGLYVYGSIPNDTYYRSFYNRLYWYVGSYGNAQRFCICNSIYFHDDYDSHGNFTGRNVTITDGIELFSFSLPATIGYSYDLGGVGFYYNRLIVNDDGCPSVIYPMPIFGNGGYDGSANLITQKIWIYNLWSGIAKKIDAYWGSLNNFDVVQIGESYYFKAPNMNLLVIGDGSEGSVRSINIIVSQGESAELEYVEAYVIEIPKYLRVRLEIT
jgi:hypothetical protein